MRTRSGQSKSSEMESTDTELSSNLSIPDLIAKLKTSKTGLSQEEADQRLSRYGPNELKEQKDQSLSGFSPELLGTNSMDD